MNQTEQYNGTAWASSASLGTPVSYHGGAGNTSSAISFNGMTSGSPASATGATEEYTGSTLINTASTLTTS